jgi:X-X-X-Leu-X-X-Gly heptad repeat protein
MIVNSSLCQVYNPETGISFPDCPPLTDELSVNRFLSFGPQRSWQKRDHSKAMTPIEQKEELDMTRFKTALQSTAGILRKCARLALVPAVALAILATPETIAGFQTGIGVEQAEAGAKKKVKFGLKIASKGLKFVEKAGKAAQKKRGIVGKAGGILKNTAKGGQKGISKASKGVDKLSKGAAKLANKTKVGKNITKGFKKAKGRQDQVLDAALKSCKGGTCRFVRGGVDLVSPL